MEIHGAVSLLGWDVVRDLEHLDELSREDADRMLQAFVMLTGLQKEMELEALKRGAHARR